MSEDSESEQKKKDQPSEAKQEEKTSASSDTTSQTQQKPKTAPMIGTPRPTSTQVGTTSTTPPPTSTPVAARPVGTPIGAPRPSVGTPLARPGAPSPAAPSGPLPAKPAPTKPPESKVEVSRRNFIKGLAVLGGLAVVASYVPLYPFLTASVGAQSLKDQQLVLDPDVTPATPITPGAVGNGIAFTYPYTGDPNIDADTFVQCVLIKLPSNLTIPSSYDQYTAKDSSGNTYIAFSRVCVHLWCLWGTGINTSDTQVGGPVLGPCPCHGSTYIPGSGSKAVYPNYPNAVTQNGQAVLPGQAVAGPASLQPFPNNMLPIIKIRIASDGTFHANGRVGLVGYCQQC